MSNKILITGSAGQLGGELRRICINTKYNQFVFCDKSTLDMTDYEKVEDFVVANDIEVIVNCAAYTNVDSAEDMLEEAELLNYGAVQNLASISLKHNIKIIHISTDYVFGGDQSRPYTEDSCVNPLNVYGRSKYRGEKSLMDINSDNIVIRTSWFYSEFGNNFVKTIIRLANERESINVVTDQIGSPTYASDLAELILFILESRKYKDMSGVYHYSNEGVASWYDFAIAIVDLAKLECDINPVFSDEYDAKARRPLYSVLDKRKIKKELNISIPHWRNSLRKLIKRLM